MCHGIKKLRLGLDNEVYLHVSVGETRLLQRLHTPDRMDVWWLSLGLGVAAVWLFYTWSTRNHEHWAKRGVAFIKPIPFFGTMFTAFSRQEHMVDTFTRFYNELKPHKIGGLYEFNTPMLLIADPDVVREITVKHFDHFSNRRVIVGQQTDPLFARSLPSLQDAEWREMRNRLSPAFTTSKLKGMFPFISHCGEKFASYFVNRPDAGTEPVEFKNAFTRLTNDVIATIVFGVDGQAIANPESKFYKFALHMTNFSGIRLMIVFLFMLMPKVMEFFGISFIPKDVTEYFSKLIKDTMDHREKTGEVRPDMLQMLMEAKKGGIQRAHDDEHDAGTVGEDEQAKDLHKKHLAPENSDKNLISDGDITAQTFIFFFAGFETVATMMSFLAHELAVNPDVQEKLRAEVDAVITKNNGKITYEMVQGMKFLDMVISESLRKYPPAGFTDRMCTKTFKVPGTEVVVDKGTAVMVPMYPLQHDPEFFPDPERFDPERFSDENKGNIRPYTYLPFGSGPHNCIGMRLALLEVKVCMIYLMATCELKVSAKTQVPLKLTKKSFQMTTDAGFWLTPAPRENPSIKV